MHWAGWTAIGLAAGLAAGIATGKLSFGTTTPGPAPKLAGVEVAVAVERAAPLFADATPAVAPLVPTTVAAELAAPVAAADAKPPSEIIVLPHGPGHFAHLDLAAAGVASLPIYAGAMTRDGPAQLTSIQRAAKVGTLKGPEAEFEWLHAGFDREARLVAAHVRLPDGGVEGIVVLAVNRKGQPELLLPLRPNLPHRGGEPSAAGAPKIP